MITKSQLGRLVEMINEKLVREQLPPVSIDWAYSRPRIEQDGRQISARFVRMEECKEWLYGFDSMLDLITVRGYKRDQSHEQSESTPGV